MMSDHLTQMFLRKLIARGRKRLRRSLGVPGLALKSVCRRYGLDYALIIKPKTAGLGTDDSYWVCGNLLQVFRGQISYLYVEPYGNFGNNYHQLVFASAFAEALGSLPVFHPSSPSSMHQVAMARC